MNMTGAMGLVVCNNSIQVDDESDRSADDNTLTASKKGTAEEPARLETGSSDVEVWDSTPVLPTTMMLKKKVYVNL